MISIEQIKQLREKTGAGMASCKDALMEAEGNFDKAIEILRQKGLASAEKKLTRNTKQGVISSYIHTGSKLGVLLELNCETDFVARRVEFQNLAKNLAMQVAASPSVLYVSLSHIPSDIWESEKRIESLREDLKGKNANFQEIILKARIQKNLINQTLLAQTCLRDPQLTVEQYIKNHVSLLGENIQVARFERFILGESKGEQRKM
jgi:elongation factor Ts